jgi:hypothetical protein
MFANGLFLDVIEAPAVILQENRGRVIVRVHDLIEEDLPDPERDKVGFLNAALASASILARRHMQQASVMLALMGRKYGNVSSLKMILCCRKFHYSRTN